MSKQITRRNFVKQCSMLPLILPSLSFGKDKWRKEAMYYKKLGHDRVECQLCPNQCIINEGNRGICRVRENQGGILYTLVYGRLVSMNVDPIEKKPLYHFLPGEKALSIATAGCNVHCQFCQNWSIAQANPEDIQGKYYSPEKLIKTAEHYKIPIIAFTYNEPIVFYEYMLDAAKLATKAGIKTVMISNGYINAEPMKQLCHYLSGIKIDFKGYSEKFYRELVRGRLQPVLQTMETVYEEKKWLEIVNLVIPTHNDAKPELQALCQWMHDHLGDSTPLHFSRFYPQYLMKNLPPTTVKKLNQAYEIAQDIGLNYIYLGNIPQDKTDDTNCPDCGKCLIERNGYHIEIVGLKNGACKHCGQEIPGVWE